MFPLFSTLGVRVNLVELRLPMFCLAITIRQDVCLLHFTNRSTIYRHLTIIKWKVKPIVISGVGGSEGLTDPVKKFIEVVKSRNYNSLKWDTLIAKDERHAGNKPEIYNRGLRFIFSK